MPKHKFNLKFINDQLRCACLFGNPCCGNFLKCEVQELDYNPFENVEDCMKARAYVRSSTGAVKEIK